jgi:hypothetical protein
VITGLVLAAIFLMAVLGLWILLLANAQHAQRIAAYRFDPPERETAAEWKDRASRSPEIPWLRRGPGPHAIDPRQASTPDAVHSEPSVGWDRRDHRDGGRGRRPTRRHAYRLHAGHTV